MALRLDEVRARHEGPAITASAVRRRAGRWAPAAVLVAGLAAAGLLLVESARQLWFFGDDWDFLLYRGTLPGPDLGWFAPHNEHWSTIPILIYRFMFAAFGMRHYLPYALAVIVAHLGVCALMFLLLVAFGASRWVAVAVSLFLAFLGAGAENTLWDFQIGFVGAVFFGLLALWLYDRHEQSGWPTRLVWLALILALMCSGVGLPMLAVLCVYAGARRGLAGAARVGSVPLAVYAVWYLQWGRLAAHQGPAVSSRWDYLQVPTFVWTGLTTAWQLSSGIPGSGALILAVLIGAALVVRGRSARLSHFAWAGLAGALAMFVLAGLFRIQLGVGQAQASRYTYVASVLMAPALALALQLVADRLPDPRWVPTCLVVGIGALVIVNGVLQTHQYLEGRKTMVLSQRDQVLGLAFIMRSGDRVLSTVSDPDKIPGVSTTILRSPPFQSALPGQPVGAQAQLDAAAQLLVGVGSARLPISSAPTATLQSGFTSTAVTARGCHDYPATASTPVIELPPSTGGSQIRITGATTSVTTVLRRGALASSPLSWAVRPGSPIFVGTSAPHSNLEITLDHGGTVMICT